ncbi:MAG: sugar ABC transporter ATP-binding protein [Halanaerobiales bacterium]
MDEKVVSTRGVCKDYGPVRVLFDIDFTLRKGEIHAVIGENGAGKSTLMKIISGFHRPTEGKLYFREDQIYLDDIAEGEKLGIVMIHQELNLAEDLTVEENIFLGKERLRSVFLDKKEMLKSSRSILQQLNTGIDPRTPVKDLSVSNKQMVEIAKAVSREASVLIMDEPTSSLTRNEINVLFDLMRNLRDEGVSIIFVSHKLDEVKEIADRITVLRDGYLITTRSAEELTEEEMANLMVGRDIEDMYPDKIFTSEAGKVVLGVKNITVPGWVKNASFELYKGEILGFAGLVGAGRTELLESVVGLRARDSGEIYRDGQKIQIDSLQDAIDVGLVYLSEDRKGRTLLTNKSISFNLTLLALKEFCDPFIDEEKEEEALSKAVEEFEIKAPDLEASVNTLSGGNQQKLALAKIMQVEPEIIILDEPTRGIDVGTKQQIYYFVKELVEQGKSCIMVSSELQEIIGLCHRVVVMHNGIITGVLNEGELNEEEIMHYATGLKGVS